MTATERADLRAAAKALGADLLDLTRGYLRFRLDGRGADGVGAYCWEECDGRGEALAEVGLAGWPTCECAAGDGCGEPATTADQGVPVCAGCESGAVWSTDGDSDCECCGSGERVVWDGSEGYAGAYVYNDAPEEPETDADGEWAVIGMDGEEHGRYASREDAEAAVEREAALFSRASVCGSNANAYLPRSVCHIACGKPVRAGQWTASWYVPGCDHVAVEKA